MEKCKESVQDRGPGFGRFHPCRFKAIKDGLCHIHTPEAIAAREKKSRELWEKNRPWKMALFKVHLRSIGLRKRHKALKQL